MTKKPVRPVPPKDFAASARLTLDHGDSDICIDAVQRMRGPLNPPSDREARCIGMASYPAGSLPSWIRHEAGEAWSSFSKFIANGGTEFCPEFDDPQDVCTMLSSMPEGLLKRLDPVFVGLKRGADPDGFFQHKFIDVCSQYVQSMKTAFLLSGSGHEEMYRNSARVLKAAVPAFAEFFDDLRSFIGDEACIGGRWREGDSWREEWDMSLFERRVVWG